MTTLQLTIDGVALDTACAPQRLIADLCLHLRDAQGLSEREAVARSGGRVSLTTLRRVESASTNVTIAMLARLLATYDVGIDVHIEAHPKSFPEGRTSFAAESR